MAGQLKEEEEELSINDTTFLLVRKFSKAFQWYVFISYLN
jgi:hypothetical protein